MGEGEWVELLEVNLLKIITMKYCKKLSDTISVKENIKIRNKRKGFKKFVYELWEGWFLSGDKKIKNGVYKTRIIDKENKRYYEHVKDYENEEILRNCEEDLKKHRK